MQADGSLGDAVTAQLNTLNEPTNVTATHRTVGLTDQVTSYAYDNGGPLTVGNLTSVVRDARTGGFNLATNIGYTGTAGSYGLPTSTTDAAIGATSTLIYDPSHGYLPCSSTSPYNLSLQATEPSTYMNDPDYQPSTSLTLFNADNLPSQVRDPLYPSNPSGHYVSIGYAPDSVNSANLVVTHTYPDSTTDSATIDPLGRTLKSVDQNGVVTQMTYNPAGQVKTVTEAVGLSEQRTTTYHYNAQGDLSAIDPANGTSGTIR
jgi:YD repeat-containing protein